MRWDSSWKCLSGFVDLDGTARTHWAQAERDDLCLCRLHCRSSGEWTDKRSTHPWRRERKDRGELESGHTVPSWSKMVSFRTMTVLSVSRHFRILIEKKSSTCLSGNSDLYTHTWIKNTWSWFLPGQRVEEHQLSQVREGETRLWQLEDCHRQTEK